MRQTALIALSCGFLLLSSCRSYPGATYQTQVEGLQWSTEVLFFDETPVEQLKFIADDFRTLFVGESWSEDSEHLAESFAMLGW